MKDNFIKKFAQKLKRKFSFRGDFAGESNVCIKVFNCVEGDVFLENKNLFDRKQKAVIFYDEGQLLGKGLAERKEMMFEKTNKIIECENIFER